MRVHGLCHGRHQGGRKAFSHADADNPLIGLLKQTGLHVQAAGLQRQRQINAAEQTLHVDAARHFDGVQPGCQQMAKPTFTNRPERCTQPDAAKSAGVNLQQLQGRERVVPGLQSLHVFRHDSSGSQYVLQTPLHALAGIRVVQRIAPEAMA